ncbi:MAG: SusC/RagA family TonB-linked outer membrane protein, partial [Bacteroidota bacterium]
EKGAYYVSGNYRSDKGVLDHNQLDRLSLRSNLQFEPIKNLRIETRLNFSYTNNERREDDMTTLTKFSLPWMPVYDPNNPNNYFNPYADANIAAANDPQNTLNNVKQYRGLANLSVQYSLPQIKGLAFRTELSTDLIQSNLVNWNSRAIRLNGDKDPSAGAREEAVTFQSINYNGYLNFDREFGKLGISAVLGAEAQRTSEYQRILAGEGLVGNYQELGNPGTPLTVEARLDNERYLLGYFGRLNLRLGYRYLLGISARRDGSSAFAADQRWGNFVALSTGWILSEEPFLDFLPSDVYLKVRASYGETGNQNVPNNLQAINYFDRVVYGDRSMASNGTLPSNLPVDDLTWETSRSADLGLDFGVWNNRLSGTVGYYRRLVDGMLLEAQLPASAGVSPNRDIVDFGFVNTVENTNKIWSNIGNMLNTGLEIELNTVNISRPNFSWNTSFNISFNENRIKGLTPDLDQGGGGITSAYTISRTGNRRNVWYVADWAGVDPATGVPQVYALDQEHFIETGNTRRLQDDNGEDVLILGTRANIRENRFIQDEKSSDPTYYGGITNRLTYKGWDFSFFFAFSGGNYLLDYDRQTAAYPNETRLVLRDVLSDSWRNPGDVATYPNLVARQTHEVSDGEFISDFGDEDVFHNRELYAADFVRLRNVTLGYNFPKAKLERLRLSRLRLYCTATNLLTFTEYPGFDPEGIPNQITQAHILYWNTPIPQLKTFTVGIDVNF